MTYIFDYATACMNKTHNREMDKRLHFPLLEEI